MMKRKINVFLMSCLTMFSLLIISEQRLAVGSSCDAFRHDTGICGTVKFPKIENNSGVIIECPSSCLGNLTTICINGEITSVEGVCTPPPLQPSALTSPPLGVPITSSPVVFKWAASPSPGAYYSLIVGTSPGASDLLNLKQTKNTSTRPVKVPIDGGTIYFLLNTTDMFGQTAGFGGQYQTLVVYPICNNELCQAGETCESCPQDFGECTLSGEEVDPDNEITIGEFINIK